MTGRRNVSSVTLQALGENRFCAAEIYGKLANICGDIDARTVKRTDLFKQMVGGDAIYAERKHRDPFTFVSIATPLFSANEAPMTSDQTQAYFDRWITIPFPNRFRGTDREDPDLVSKLCTADELEGVLVGAVEGLRRLVARGRFDIPPSVERKTDEYRETLDSVRAFLKERCEFVGRGKGWVPRPGCYRDYQSFCEAEGRNALKAPNFYARLREDYRGHVEAKTRRGVRGFTGIKLKPRIWS